MKLRFYISIGLVFLLALKLTAQNVSNLVEENTTFATDGITFNGYLVYDQNNKGKKPAVIVVHEWWGLNDYPKMRARELAQLGYVAYAIDLYGKGKTAANPTEAQELATPFYKNPQMARTRIDAAIEKLKQNSQVDADKIAAIGYCFGGGMVLNYAKLGGNVKGVVSFHGNLAGAPANKDLLKAKILVCHGEKDKFVSQKEVDAFKHQMDSIKADYTFKSYPNATHAFTNPNATKAGKQFNMPIEYNAEADKKSWDDMKTFLEKIFK